MENKNRNGQFYTHRYVGENDDVQINPCSKKLINFIA